MVSLSSYSGLNFKTLHFLGAHGVLGCVLLNFEGGGVRGGGRALVVAAVEDGMVVFLLVLFVGKYSFFIILFIIDLSSAVPHTN